MDTKKYESTIQEWIECVRKQHENDPEQTLKYCNDIISEGLKRNDSALAGFGYFYSAEIYYCLNEGDMFFDSVTKAISYLESAQEWELLAKSYNFLGIMSAGSGNIPAALDYYSNGLKICEEHQIDSYRAALLINLGGIDIAHERYEDALHFMRRAKEAVNAVPENARINYLIYIYENVQKCLVGENEFERAEEIRDIIFDNYWEPADENGRIAINFCDVIYLHKRGMEKERDEKILWLNEKMKSQIPVMDYSEEICDYGNMLIEADKPEAFWEMMESVEPVVASLHIIRLSQQILSLKMQFYRKNGERKEYLEAAGEYYELCEQMEEENRRVNKNIIMIRRNLDNSNRLRQKMEEQNQILLEKSRTDPMTGLANRSSLNDYSERAILENCLAHKPLTVEILDVDFFKEYNDNYGHQKGDECLNAVAAVLKKMKKKYGAFAARYGGDEFMLIFSGQTKKQAVACAEEIRLAMQEINMEHSFSKAAGYVSLSQGVCWGIPETSSHMWDFLHAADEMLYHVKRTGRNNFCFCDISETEQYFLGGSEFAENH